MNETPSSERKYDTLRLIKGVPPTDKYPVEDILQEYARPAAVNQTSAAPLSAVPLEPPRMPQQHEAPAESFFSGPPETDSLGDDFWQEPSGPEGDELWDEIESMGRKKARAPREPLRIGRQPEPAGEPEPEPAPAVAKPLERDSARQRRRRLQEAEERMPKPDIPPERMVRRYSRLAQSARRRLPLVGVLSLLGLYFTLAGSFGWLAPERAVLCRLLGVLGLLAPVLCYDLVIQTIYDLCRLRFRAPALVLAGTVCTVADAFASAGAGTHVPYCALSMLGWLGCLWAAYDHRLALRRTAKVVEHGVDYAVRSAPELWNGTDCIVRTEGDASGFLREAEQTDYAAQLMQYYVPLAMAGSLVLSLVVTLGRGGNLLQSLAAMLTAATPLAAACCFARPFSLLSRRLYKRRAALCGWMGAELLGGYQAVVIRDEDIFPAGAVSMNGAKFYEGFDRNYVISCTATVLREAGGGLAPVFAALAEEFRTGYGQMTSYRAYEGGGYGANIGQDIVLLGTVGFMRLMGIPIPDGTNLRQAVYVSINNQIAGIFSINYAPTRASRNGLDALCAQRRLVNLFATRDFILNPSLLRQRFRLTGGRMEFPPVEERLRLSRPDCGAQGRRAALLSRDSFDGYSDTVAGGRQLYNLTRGSSIFCIFSGVIGLLLIFLLSYLGETVSATVANLMLYCVLWALPPLLITSWVDKY